MKKWLSELWMLIAFFSHLPRIGWSLANGNWYIFRDMPLYVVAICASWEDLPDDDRYQLARQAAQQAKAELQLRMQRAERDLEAGGNNTIAILEGKAL